MDRDLDVTLDPTILDQLLDKVPVTASQSSAEHRAVNLVVGLKMLRSHVSSHTVHTLCKGIVAERAITTSPTNAMLSHHVGHDDIRGNMNELCLAKLE